MNKMREFLLLGILSSSVVLSANLSPDLRSGLIGYYSFNGTLLDTTDGLNQMVNYGTTFSPGPIPGQSALAFSNGQYGAIRGLGSKINDAVTVSAWYKFDPGLMAPLEYGSGFKAVMYSGTLPDGSNPCFRINAQISQGQSMVHFQLNLGDSNFPLQNPSFLVESDVWNYITLAVQAGSNPAWRFYVNGVLCDSGANGVPSSLNFGYDYGVGSTIEAGTAYWGTFSNGGMANLAFYDRALDSLEVTELFAIESIPEPSALSLFAVGLCGLVIFRRRPS